MSTIVVKKKKKLPAGERVFGIVNGTVMVLLAATFLVPFLVVLSTSFVSEAELMRRGAFVLIPEEPTLLSYQVLLGAGSSIYRGYMISILRVVVGTFLNLAFTGTMAYGLSKRSLPGRNTITSLVFITMIFSGGLIPNFLLYQGLGITDTFWVMILPGLISPWNMFLMRNFFMQIPESLEEAAVIDGATPLKIFMQIMLPLSKPALATIGMFYAVGHWNAWFDASVFINNDKLYPIQVIMRNIVIAMSATDVNNEMLVNVTVKPPSGALKAAAIIVATLPILCIYPFLQRFFVKGLIVGSVKG